MADMTQPVQSPPPGLRQPPSVSRRSARELRGVAAARGSWTGIARVILSEGDLGRLGRGDVLVCRAIRPSWAPVFRTIGALVTDSGGMLCSAATVAREYRIAAVVATEDGTSRIRDGARIKVDGDTGIVTVLG